MTTLTDTTDPIDAILGTDDPTTHARPLAEADLWKFITAGRAVFTVVSPRTSARFTFKVTRKEVDDGAKALFFVSLLSGPDNTSDYQFLGTLFGVGTATPSYRHGARSRVGASAPSATAIAWLLGRLVAGKDLKGVHVHHEGKCGRCGRALTVPSSIESGFGPECAGKV